MKRILAILAGVLTVAAFVGLCYKVDLRWVRCEVYAKESQAILDKIAGVEKRQEQMIALDKAQKLQERVWDLERFYRGARMPEPIRREVEHLKIEIKRIYDLYLKEPMPPKVVTNGEG